MWSTAADLHPWPVLNCIMGGGVVELHCFCGFFLYIHCVDQTIMFPYILVFLSFTRAYHDSNKATNSFIQRMKKEKSLFDWMPPRLPFFLDSSVSPQPNTSTPGEFLLPWPRRFRPSAPPHPSVLVADSVCASLRFVSHQRPLNDPGSLHFFLRSWDQGADCSPAFYNWMIVGALGMATAGHPDQENEFYHSACTLQSGGHVFSTLEEELHLSDLPFSSPFGSRAVKSSRIWLEEKGKKKSQEEESEMMFYLVKDLMLLQHSNAKCVVMSLIFISLCGTIQKVLT